MGAFSDPALILPGAVDTAELADNAVTTGKIKDGEIVDADVNPAALFLPITSQNIVTGSRVLGTIYQNTTGKPMYVSIVTSIGGVGCDFEIKTDSSATPSDVVSTLHQAASTHDARSFIVLPNNYCSIAISAGSGGTIGKWVEWY